MRKKDTISCPNCGSQIIHHSTLRLKEKLLAYLIPTEIYQCQPCGSRFTRRGNPFAHQASRRVLLPLVLMVIFLVSLLIVWMFDRGNNSQKLEHTREKVKEAAEKTSQPGVTKETVIDKIIKPREPDSQKQETRSTTPKTITEKESIKTPVNTIKLGASRRFGVNWEYDGRGLIITRMSPGPLQEAGLKIGDILVSLDGKPLTDDGEIIRVRDEIFSGERREALIEALRGREKFLYKLIK